MISLIILLIILLIKILIINKAQAKAVDQWYWLKYRDAVKVQKKCPPELPEYLLEIKQWYPPFFGWFISKLPDSIFKHSSFLIQLLSFIRLMLIVGFTYVLNVEFSISLFLAIVIYLTAPILVYYDNQINSRIFGAIILDILILLFFGYFEHGLSYMILPIVLLSILLLFTHKMSHQLYAFLLVGLSFFYMSLIPILIYIVANIVALLFFNYKIYLKAHIEIVKFWHRNRYKLGAHQFYESTIYGEESFVYQNRLHGNGIKSFVKKTLLIVGMLPILIFIIFNFQLNFFGLIIVMTLLFILLTSFIDHFLCLGVGSLYTYNVVTFLGLYLVYTEIDYNLIFNQLLLTLIFILTFLSIYKFYRGLKSQNMNKELDDAIFFLKQSELDRVMVIPFQLPDEVTYKTGKKVFWGGHGYGFLWLEPYFPVFNAKIEKAIEDWNLGTVFLKKDYFREFFDVVDMSLFEIAFENEVFVILSIKNWNSENKIPKWAIDKYPDIFRSKNV